jgi:hypothetical protein
MLLNGETKYYMLLVVVPSLQKIHIYLICICFTKLADPFFNCIIQKLMISSSMDNI